MTGIVAHTYPEWWLKLTGQAAHWSTDYSRKIVTKLELCPYDKRNQILVSLKTRINAYGIDQNKLNADAHIWKLIDKINICREEEYANLKEQLIYYLSLLLKYDWERSKSEVYGEPIKILVYTMYLFAGSLGSYGIYQCVDTSLKNLLPYLFEIDIIIFFAAIVLIMLKRVMKRDKSSSILLYDGTIIVGSALLGIGAKNSLNWNDLYIKLAFVIACMAEGIQLLNDLDKCLKERLYCQKIAMIRKKYLISIEKLAQGGECRWGDTEQKEPYDWKYEWLKYEKMCSRVNKKLDSYTEWKQDVIRRLPDEKDKLSNLIFYVKNQIKSIDRTLNFARSIAVPIYMGQFAVAIAIFSNKSGNGEILNGLNMALLILLITLAVMFWRREKKRDFWMAYLDILLERTLILYRKSF